MVNILIEGMTENAGGKETYIVNIYRALDKNKYRFSFVSYSDKIAYEDSLIESGAEIVKLPPRSKGLFAFRKSVKQHFAHHEYDVVWSHKTTLSSCEVLEYAKKNKIPLRIVHSHSSSNMGGKLTYILHRINQRRLKRWANIFFACSEEAARWFYKNDECLIMKNGIDIDKFRFNPVTRARIAKELGLENQLVVGHVGRFGVEKNHSKLVDVFAELVKQHKNAVLLLCGDGEERKKIEEKVVSLRLQEKVRFLGVVSNVNELLQVMDVFVMPSLFEGLPFAMLEAQASGLNCVVSDTVSREADVTGQNVFLSLDEEDAVWAEKVYLAVRMENREGAANMLAQAGFSLAENAKQIDQLFDARL